MSFKNIDWTSCNRLSCVGCAPADVILCVNSDKVAPSICPGTENNVTPTEEDFAYRYITAQLISSTRIKNSCGAGFYKYYFTYDDAQIKVGETLLTTDINGAICKGCLTTWIEDFVGDEPTLIPNGDGTFTYTSPHGCLTTFREFVPEAASAGCSNLSFDLILDNSWDPSYDPVLLVEDNSGFTAGDLIQFVFNHLTYIFTVTGKVGDQLLRVHLESPTLSAVKVIDQGTEVCIRTDPVPDSTCSPLAYDLILDPSADPADVYVILVEDNTNYNVSDIINIVQDNVVYTFTVDGKVSTQFLRCTLTSPTLSSIITIEQGTLVCDIS